MFRYWHLKNSNQWCELFRGLLHILHISGGARLVWVTAVPGRPETGERGRESASASDRPTSTIAYDSPAVLATPLRTVQSRDPSTLLKAWWHTTRFNSMRTAPNVVLKISRAGNLDDKVVIVKPNQVSAPFCFT